MGAIDRASNAPAKFRIKEFPALGAIACVRNSIKKWKKVRPRRAFPRTRQTYLFPSKYSRDLNASQSQD
jgi:hypothetical protein